MSTCDWFYQTESSIISLLSTVFGSYRAKARARFTVLFVFYFGSCQPIEGGCGNMMDRSGCWAGAKAEDKMAVFREYFPSEFVG